MDRQTAKANRQAQNDRVNKDFGSLVFGCGIKGLSALLRKRRSERDPKRVEHYNRLGRAAH